MKNADIVIGVIFDGNKFLMERRKQDEKSDPGLAMFPSGHVEKNETKEEALKREMKEELNIKVKRMKFIKKDLWVASDGEKQNLYYYLISGYEGKPVCKAAKELIWTENVNELDTDVDRKVMEKLTEKKIEK